ncbi:MAG: hypothetical protein ABSG87_07280 [Verrucomicrobiota bacterium]|jgi:hypothetical protein
MRNKRVGKTEFEKQVNHAQSSRNQNGNEADASRRDVASYSNCIGEWSGQYQPALLLLDMMKCPCVPTAREALLEKTNPNRESLIELEALWQSLGCPRSKLWLQLRLHVLES